MPGEFKVDDCVWIHWSSGAKMGWITSVVEVPHFHKEGTFTMYGILQEDGTTFERVAKRLLEHA